MLHVFLIPLLCLKVIVCGQESELLRTYRVYQTKQNTGRSNTKSSIDLLDTQQEDSVIACNRRCIHNANCLAFFYDTNMKTCRLHGVLLNATSADDFTAEEGNRFYQLERERLVGESCIADSECIMKNSTCSYIGLCACIPGYGLHPVQKTCETGITAATTVSTTTQPGTTAATTVLTTTQPATTTASGVSPTPLNAQIGDSCSGNNDCMTDNSECRDGSTCGCKAGYSFNSSTQTCASECTVYGDTFQYFPNHVLLLWDIYFVASTSSEDCKELCIEATAYTCVSIDYYKITSVCYHQAVDPSDHPLSYVEDMAYDFYQRECL